MYKRLDYAIFVKSDTIVTVYWKLLIEEVPQQHFLAIHTLLNELTFSFPSLNETTKMMMTIKIQELLKEL